MRKVYFVTKEQYEAFDKAIKPQERFADMRLGALGVKNRVCGDSVLVATSEYADNDLPAKFYLAIERNPVGGA